MALIEPRRDRSWPHPIADATADDGTHRRLTLRTGLGTRSADKRLCEAANRILGGLKHPNVHHASAVERDDQDRLVVVYEHDALEPAGLHLGTNDATFVAHILHEACEALDAAHGLGVIHGALTPAAVRIEPHVDAPRVRVCDFGLGHLFGSSATLEGRVAWLPYSPEKQLGLEPTPAEDVYLLGVFGYALLTGRPLFEAPTHKQILRMHALESSADRVRNILGCEPWLADVLARCLETEPEDRFSCPADVADALRPQLPKRAPVVAVVAPEVAPPPKPRSTLAPPPPPPTSRLPIPKPAPAVTEVPPSAPGPVLPAFEATAMPPTPVREDPEPSVPTVATSISTAPEQRPLWMTRHGLLAAAGLALLGLGVWALLPSTTETRDPGATESPSASMAATARSAEAIAPALPEPADAPDQDVREDAHDAPTDPSDEVPLDEPELDALAPDDPALDETPVAADLDRPSVDPADPGLTPEQRQAEAEQLCLEALAARRSGRTNDAIRLYKRALAVRANHAPALHALGTIYFNRQDYPAAIRYEKKAAQAQPKRSAYELALGDYYFKSGNGASARRHWTKASRLGSKLAKKRLAEE